ncbi:hypothetical protein [Pseudomonas sp. S2_H01]
MNNQAQVDAIEHLLVAVLRQQTDKDVERIFEKAQGTIMGSAGPGGTTQKTEAVDYLRHIKINLR